jgi:hypothetical protein
MRTGVVVGFVIGISLGALPVFASGTWTSIEQYLDRSVAYQEGYVEGAADLLTTIVSSGDDADPALLRRLDACLDRHSAAARSDFRRWALGAARQLAATGSGKDRAASALVAQACQ